jgi:hypothetical protein
MTLEANIKRLFWRFQNGKFTPNEQDIKSLTEIVEWINREKQQTLKHNVLFAKLYIKQFLEDYKTFNDFKFAQYALHSYLDKPITSIYEMFADSLNEIELINFCKEKGIDLDTHPLLKDLNEKERERIILEQLSDDFLNYLDGKWSYDKIEKSLNNQITEAINRYKNVAL